MLTKTTTETDVSELSQVLAKEDASIALFALVEALSYEILSEDAWWLANHHAKKLAVQKYGMSEESYLSIIEKIEQARKKEKTKNPMASMF